MTHQQLCELEVKYLKLFLLVKDLQVEITILKNKINDAT